MTQELVRLGFTEMDAETAVQGVGQPSLPACLDWLCLHLPEEDLPPAFAPGHPSLPGFCPLSLKDQLQPRPNPNLIVLLQERNDFNAHRCPSKAAIPCCSCVAHMQT